RQDSTWRNGLAGACLALATWIKIYPGLVLLGLLALRRGRALASFALTFAAIWLSDHRGVRLFRENMTWFAGSYKVGIAPAGHSLSTWWGQLWADTWLSCLTEVPGLVGAAGTLLPLALWVSFHVFCCTRPAALIYPYLLWLTALATFVAP